MKPIDYYSKQILKYMADIERLNGYTETFEKTYPELTNKFWKAVDSNNESKLIYLNNEICKLIDDLKGM